MNFLVDGNNYLRRAGLFRGSKLELARRQLAGRLRTLARKGDRVTIVWDARGAPPGLPSYEPAGASAEHIFARRTETADDEILLRLRHAERPREYCVISDDRDITRPAKQLGASVCSVREAELRITAAGGRHAPPGARGDVDEVDGDEKPPAPKAGEVAEWLELFGGEPP